MAFCEILVVMLGIVYVPTSLPLTAIAGQKWYLFRNMIANKQHKQGLGFCLAKRYYPSSKCCNCCGNIKKYLKLSERTYVCEACGYVEDRDFNASFNLRDYPEVKSP